ncbi:MAG: hypothetical protein AVDCRST_MAG59-2552, partial [uncultured Thermomicrobiales bacterium]
GWQRWTPLRGSGRPPSSARRAGDGRRSLPRGRPRRPRRHAGALRLRPEPGGVGARPSVPGLPGRRRDRPRHRPPLQRAATQPPARL